MSLRLVAYTAIRDAILRGELAPGAAISEMERADWLGISRTPVREAIQALAKEGLVQVLPKRGTFVTRLTPRDVRETFELRAAIEATCAALAAERRTEESLAHMRAALHGAADPARSYEQGTIFHGLVVEAAQNRYLREVFLSGRGIVDLASQQAGRAATQHSSEGTHEAILEAMRDGDAATAAARMRRHLDENARTLIDGLL